MSPPPRKLLQVCGEWLRPSHGQSQLQYHIWHHLILDEDVWFLSSFVPQPLHRGRPRNNSFKKAEFVLRSGREYPKKSFSTLQWNNLKEPDQPFILLRAFVSVWWLFCSQVVNYKPERVPKCCCPMNIIYFSAEAIPAHGPAQGLHGE